jgi:hypothetical protein
MAKTDNCRNCVYGYWDGSLWLRTLWSGFPAGPMCANHSDTPGIMREVPGRPCRNYRPKPPEPGAQAKRIVLTNGMVAYVDACDYEEISRYTWCLVIRRLRRFPQIQSRQDHEVRNAPTRSGLRGFVPCCEWTSVPAEGRSGDSVLLWSAIRPSAGKGRNVVLFPLRMATGHSILNSAVEHGRYLG